MLFLQLSCISNHFAVNQEKPIFFCPLSPLSGDITTIFQNSYFFWFWKKQPQVLRPGVEESLTKYANDARFQKV